MKFDRPLEEKELIILDLELERTDIPLRKQFKFMTIWAGVALVIGTIAYFKINPDDIIVLFLTVASYIGLGFWIVAEQRLKQNRRRKSFNYLKEKNLVTVVQIRSETYFLLEEEDDEGDFYLFQLADNQIFSFGGQDFYENDKFPSNDFEIIEGRGIKNEILILEIDVRGEKIKPAKIISGKQKWDMLASPSYPLPDKLTIAEGRIEDYIK